VKTEVAAVEALVSAALDRGDYKEAATRLLGGYGREILAFLVARTGNVQEASEAFSAFSEDLWLGLPRFERRASARVWAYTVARHAAIRLKSAPHRRAERNVPLSEAAELAEVEARARTETLDYLRTEKKDRIARLRDDLPEEDRTLLVLRINRAMSWEEVARVFLSEENAVDDASLRKEAARLRKRFQLVTDKLRHRAKAMERGDD